MEFGCQDRSGQQGSINTTASTTTFFFTTRDESANTEQIAVVQQPRLTEHILDKTHTRGQFGCWFLLISHVSDVTKNDLHDVFFAASLNLLVFPTRR